MGPECTAEDGEGVVDVVTVAVEVDEGAGGVVLVHVAGEGAEAFGGFYLLVSLQLSEVHFEGWDARTYHG